MPIEPGTLNEFRTTLGARLENLSAYRNFIDEACEHTQISAEIAFILKLSIDEACTNIISTRSGDGRLDLRQHGCVNRSGSHGLSGHDRVAAISRHAGFGKPCVSM